MATTYLTRAMNGNSEYTGTISLWLKRTTIGASVISTFWEDSVTYQRLQFDSSDRLHWQIYDNNTKYGEAISTRKFRDTNAWYHIVCRVDSTQSTASDRVRLYVNGEVITAFDSVSYPTQNRNVKQSAVPYIGSEGTQSSNRFDGCMSHIHYTDAASYAPTVFGSTDSTTGEWKINTTPSVTYGAKGFFILKDGNSVTDQSGNSNNFTVAAGTLTNTEDNPSNNFCTFNGINPYSGTLSNGNLKMSQTNFNYNVQGTLGMESGKYYWEYKLGSTHGEFGICEQGKAGQSDPQGGTGFYMIYSNGSGGVVVYNNATGSSSTTNSGWTNFASGQIIGIAYDADNGKLYFHNNGTYYNSGDPAAGTGAVITGISPQYGGIMVPFCGHGSSSITANTEANFGNGYFGTTAISSEGTNASNIGKFEYDVPTGYTALSTKGLNE